MLVDSHCHLDSPEFNSDRDAVIQRALEAGVERMVAIGTGSGPPDLEAGIRLAEHYDCFLATAGVHPHDASKASPQIYGRLVGLLRHPRVVFAGEIGLDYHYEFSPRAVQKEVFVHQMHLAAQAGKPIVIHTREAWKDTLDLIEQHWKPSGLPGIMHCFSGGPDEARRCLDLGFYLSFGGIVTYPKAIDVQEAAKIAPLDRSLIETDSPYLAPVPKRGKRNEPAFVIHTAAHLAALHGISVEELAAATTSNFERLKRNAV